MTLTPVTAFARNCSCVVCEETGKAALIDAIRRELLSLPDEVVVIPGHGPTTMITEERGSNPCIHP